MPLVQPDNLREKLLVIGGEATGKTTAYLTIAWWAFVSGDTRKFYILDTDDEAVLHVLNESKYDGMVYSINGEVINEGGNLIIHSAYEWEEYRAFSDLFSWQHSIASRAQKGDWIILDFITHAWTAAQEGFLHDAANKSRGQALYDAGKEGLTGWEMFKTDFNWNAINGSYYDFIKPVLLKSRAHVFMVAEMEEITDKQAEKNADLKDHLLKYGRFKAVGQKKLGHQCRSYLRLQSLARGRVISTNQGAGGPKDRARKKLEGDDCNDFFQDYLVKVAGWRVEDPA